MKHVLTIAGSDCSGGAGIQADLKAMSAWGVYGMSVLTAVTAQNTRGVAEVRVLDGAIVRRQLEVLFEDIRVDGVKIGMLGTVEIVGIVAEILERYKPPLVVLDPLVVSTSGFPLLSDEAVLALKEKLFPLTDVLTPNLSEAARLTGLPVWKAEEMIQAGELLRSWGAQAVLIKGGHRKEDALDILVTAQGSRRYESPKVPETETHGTGCSLSSALTAFLARGVDLAEAVARAKTYVRQGIVHGIQIGSKTRPIHHFIGLYGAEELPL